MSLRRSLAAALLLLVPHATGGDEPGRPEEKEQETWNDVTPDWSYASAALKAPVRTNAQRALAIVERINATAADRLTTTDVIDLYRAVPYEMVRQIADTGIEFEGKRCQLSQEHSVALANLRDEMINETYRRLAAALEADLTRLDFGNKASGMKSDVDHTAYWPWDDARFGKLNIRSEFERMWETLWKLPLAECDICVHDGRNAVPDWRGTETVAEFHEKAVRVFQGLAGTPEAYAQEGAWRMQVEGRSLEGSEAVLKKLHDLEVESSKAGLTAEQQKEIAERRRAAEEGNPCTRFAYDAETKKVETSKNASILSELFRGVKGDVLRMYAFDCAVGNYLFHIHHPDKSECPKYVLRSFEEGISLLRAVPKGTALKPARYDKLDEAGRIRLIAELYPERMRDQVRRVLDTALLLRLNHKLPVDKQKPPAEVWRGMTEHLKSRAGAVAVDDETLLRMAKHEYDRASSEVMVWNNQLTAHARAQGWLSPESLPERETAELSKWLGFQRTKLQFSAFYALKQAFAYLPQDQVERIIAEAPEGQRKSLEILRDVVKTELLRNGRITLAPEAEGGLRAWARRVYDSALRGMAQRYDDFWAAAREGYYSDEAITGRVLDSLCESLGWEYRLTYEGLVRDGPTWVKEWNPAAAVRNLLTAGNVLSALQVFQVHQRGGSPDEVVAALLMEALTNLPGVAHFVAFRDALHGNWGGVKFMLTGAALQAMQDYARNRGIGFAAPFGANLLIYYTIAKTGVEILMYEVFEPLAQDDADFMYSGRIGTEEKAPPWDAEEARRLETLRRMLANARKRMAAPSMGYRSPAWEALVRETRELAPEIAALEKRKRAREEFEARAARQKAGLVRAGLKGVRQASFTPILGPHIPLQLLVAEEDDPEGVLVELAVKPLDAAERDRLDTLERQLLGLRRGEGALAPPDRVDRICALLDEIEALRERDRLGERAVRHLARLHADPEAMSAAYRQNLHAFFEKALAAAGENKTAVVEAYVKEWFDREHSQLRSVGQLAEARARVVARMVRDLEASERIFTSFELWDSRRELARMERQEKRRDFLRSLLVERATGEWLERSRPECTPHGLLLLTRSAPPSPPVIEAAAAITGEGEEARLDLRVKVTASPIQWPPPYRVIVAGAGGGASPDPKTKRRLLKVRVLAADDAEVGKAEIPLTVREIERTGPRIFWIAPLQVYGKTGVEPSPAKLTSVPDPGLQCLRIEEVPALQEQVRRSSKPELALPENLPKLVEIFPSLRDGYQRPHWIRLACGGEVRYLYRTGAGTFTPHRTTGWGSAEYLGLKPGASYPIEIAVLTEEGDRISARGVLELPPPKTSREESGTEARKRLEEARREPDPKKRDPALLPALDRYLQYVLYSIATPGCDEYVNLVQERYEVNERVIAMRGGKSISDLRFMNGYVTVERCRTIGTAKALALAQRVFPVAAALAKPGNADHLRRIREMHYSMARLAVTARADSALARTHLERTLELSAEIVRLQPQSSRWDAPKPREEAEIDWPRAFGTP